MKVDLDGEFKAACDALEARGYASIARYGFTFKIIAAVGFVGLARVAIDEDKMLFEPAESGRAAIILPVFAGMPGRSELVDLAAWTPKDPESIARRCGLGYALGEDALRAALDWVNDLLAVAPPPVRLYRTPASWGAARAGGATDGAVLLTWREPALLQLQTIVAEDVQHGEFIKKKLTQLRAQLMARLPRIEVPAVAPGAAA